MNILLFGGAFNPPHLGHLLVIEQAFELIPNIDEVWLLPCYGHAFGKEMAPADDRMNMCQLLIANHPNVKMCSIEIDHKTTGSTYETLQLLKSASIDNNYSFLMGSDQLPTFNKWHHWETLLQEMHFYVYPRGSQRHDVTLPNMTLLESPTQVITNISSTLIRERIKNNLPINRTMTKNVLQYIEAKQLYES